MSALFARHPFGGFQLDLNGLKQIAFQKDEKTILTDLPILNVYLLSLDIVFTFLITVFNLILAHTLISTQSRKVVGFQIAVRVMSSTSVVGTHLNCLEKSRQFK